jgi:hypothetical protein
LNPPASCRLSFAMYTNQDDVDPAVEALRHVVGRLGSRVADGVSSAAGGV